MDKLLGKDYVEVKIRDKDYTIAPMKIGHMVRMCNYWKNRPMRDAFQQKKDYNLSPEDFKVVLEDAKKKVKDLDIDPDTAMKLMFSIKTKVEVEELDKDGNTVKEIKDKEKVDIEMILFYIFIRLEHNEGITFDFIKELEQEELDPLLNIINGTEPSGTSEKKTE